MNVIGKTFKVVNWVLFGKGRKLIDVAEYVAQSTQIEVHRHGVVIKFKKEF